MPVQSKEIIPSIVPTKAVQPQNTDNLSTPSVNVALPEIDYNPIKQYENDQAGLKLASNNYNIINDKNKTDGFIGALNQAGQEVVQFFDPLVKEKRAGELENARIKKQNSEIKAQKSRDLMQVEKDKFTNRINNENYSDFIDTTTGIPQPNYSAIRSLTKVYAKEAGVPEDGNFSELLYNDLSTKVSQMMINSEAEFIFNKKVEQKYHKSAKQLYKDDFQAFASKKEKELLIGNEIALTKAFNDIDSKRKNDIVEVQAKYSNIEKDKNRLELRIAALNETYGGLIKDGKFFGTQQQFNDYKNEMSLIQTDSNRFEQKYKQSNEDFLNEQNAINTKANRKYKRIESEINQTTDAKYRKSLDKEYKLDPKLKKDISKLYEESVKKVLDRRANLKRTLFESKNMYQWIAESAISAIGAGLKQIGVTKGIDLAVTTGDYLSNKYQTGEEPIKSFSDFLNLPKVASSVGSVLGSSIPTLAIEIPTIALTRGMGAPKAVQAIIAGVVNNSMETLQNSSQAYTDMFYKTNGDTVAAANAFNQTVNSSTLSIPFNILSSLPFVGAFSGKFKSIGGKFLTGFGIEGLGELGPEIIQNAVQDAIGKGKDWTDFYKELSWGKTLETAANVIPGAGLTGGLGASLSSSSNVKLTPGQINEISKKAAEAYALKFKLADVSDTQRDQFIFDLAQRKGSNFASAYLYSSYGSGVIDKAEFDEMSQSLVASDKLIRQAKDLSLNATDQKVFFGFSAQYDRTKAQLEKEQDPIMKKALEAKLTDYENQIKSFTTNKKADYVVMTYPNNEQYVLTYAEVENALSKPEFINALTKNEISIDVFGEGENIKGKIKSASEAQSETIKKEEEGKKKEAEGKKKEIEGKYNVIIEDNVGDIGVEVKAGENVTAEDLEEAKQELKDAGIQVREAAAQPAATTEVTTQPVTTETTVQPAATTEVATQPVTTETTAQPATTTEVTTQPATTEVTTQPTKETTVTKTPKEGTKVQLPSKVEGGLSRNMVFSEGQWKQKVGDSTTNVSQEVQNQAQSEFNRIKEKAEKLKQKRQAKASTQGQLPSVGINISNKSQLDAFEQRAKLDEPKKNILKSAQKGIKTLKSVFPDMDIYIHEDADSYNMAMTDVGGVDNSRGNFAFERDKNNVPTGKGRIDINLSNANETTVAHEITHAVLLKSFGDSPATFKQFRDRISPILRSDLNRELIKFEKQYAGQDVAPEEYLTQLSAILSKGAEKVAYKPDTLRKIAAVINEFVSKITKGKFKPFQSEVDFKNFVGFLNTMSEAIGKGTEIDLQEKEHGDAVISGVVRLDRLKNKSDLGFKKFDIGWEVDPKSGINLNVPKDKQALYDVIEKSGGAVVVINSDATGIGVTKDNDLLQGGIGYTFIDANVKDNIGFAASNDGKISSFYEAVSDAASKRDAEFPEMKGRPVAVFVMVQTPAAMFGNAYSADYFGRVLSKITKSELFSTKEAKKELIDFIEDYKASNKTGQKYSNSLDKLSDLIRTTDFSKKESIKKLVDLLITNRSSKEDKSAKFGFDIRRSFFEKFFVGVGTVKEGAPAKNLRLKLKEKGYNHEGFFKEFGDKNVMSLLEGDTPGRKLSDGNFTLTGFFVDPNLSKEQYVQNSKQGTYQHKQFNSKFYGTDPFILDGKYYVDQMFPEARFVSKKTGEEVPVQVAAAGSLYPRTQKAPKQIIERAKGIVSKSQKEDIVSASVNVAPLYSTKVTTTAQATELHNSPFYQEFKKKNEELANFFNLTVTSQVDGIGGFAGVDEATTVVNVSGKFEDIVKYAAVVGAIAPEVQKATIAGMYVESGDKNHNADKIEIGIDNMEAALKATKDAGFSDDGFTLLDNEISFFNILDYPTENFKEKITTFANKYNEYGGTITKQETHAVRSEYIDNVRRREILGEITSSGLQQQQGRTGLRSILEQAEIRNENFVKWEEINDSLEAKEYRDLRSKQLELGEKGKSLTDSESNRIKELENQLSEPLSAIISSEKGLYEKAKAEIDAIADQVASLTIGGFKSEFGIKRPSRAAIKAVRWYDVQPNLLGDGARTNVIVNTDADADFIYNEIDKRFTSSLDRKERTTTELGYPKRLIEIKTKSGKISEIQVMTPQGYLAKDGISHFPKDAQEKAKASLDEVRSNLGWAIPDGIGHYFYEINRDTNIPKALRDQAKEISNKYYDAFLNPDSELSYDEFLNDVEDFKSKVDSADKSNWDSGNEGKSPKSLDEFIGNKAAAKYKSKSQKSEDYNEIKDLVQDYVNAGYSLQEAIDAVTEDIDDSSKETINSITDAYNEITGKPTVSAEPEAKAELPTTPEKVIFGEGEEGVQEKKAFDKLTSTIPGSGATVQYLSGETIEKYQGEKPKNEQEVVAVQLREALVQGLEIINESKRIFGDNYIESLLNYVETENLNPSNKALIYVSLENELAKRKLEEPSNVAKIEKLQMLVNAKSQAYLRSNSIAINYGRLRKFAEIGYDVTKLTYDFFSSQQLEDKKNIENAVQATASDINDQYKEEWVKLRVEEGVKAEIEKIYQKLSASDKKIVDKRVSVLDKLKGNLLNKFSNKSKSQLSGTDIKSKSQTVGDIIENGYNNIINAIKAKVDINSAIEMGVEKISNDIEKATGKKWADEAEFRKDIIEAFKQEGLIGKDMSDQSKRKIAKEILELDRQIDQGFKDKMNKKKTISDDELNKLIEEKKSKQAILEALDPTPKMFIENALIEQGYGREINVKTKEGIEKRKILDWTRLAGEEGSIDKLKENVEKALRDKGYTEEQILRMQDAFIDEYNNLRASIIEKSLNKIASKNKTSISPEQISAAKRLAEMYNMGLFDKDPKEYEIAMAKTLGLSDTSVEAIGKAMELGKVVSEMFNTKFEGKILSESQLRSAIQVIDENMRRILYLESMKSGNVGFKLSNLTKVYMDMSQRMLLNTIKQGIENPFSGLSERLFSSIGYAKSIPKELNKQQSKLARNIFKEIIFQKGIGYGDVGSAFIAKGNVDAYINGLSDNQVVQGVLSSITGKAILDAVDSSFKAKITQQKFTYNLIQVLRQDRIINGKLEKGMSAKDARNYVAEKLAGQSFEDAKETARNIIEKANSSAGYKVFNDSELFVDRLATDIVNAALVNGEKITEDMVTAAYNSAYKAAGRGLGHVSNNVITEQINAMSGKLESKINEATKEKKYLKANTLNYFSILYRNFFNPFVGGGTNWTVLKAEKTGLGLLAGLGSLAWNAGEFKVDLTTETGMKNLENALYQRMKVKDKFVRGAVGGAMSSLVYLLTFGNDDDDRKKEKYKKWLEKNAWAKKYAGISTPELTLYMMALNSDKEFKKYLESTFNDNKSFDKGELLKAAAVAIVTAEEGEGAGKVGELIGGTVGIPIPWRLARDAGQIYLGSTGGVPYQIDYSYKPETFAQGFFRGGLIDWLGYAPKPEGESMKDLSKKEEGLKILLDNGLKLPDLPSIKNIEIDEDAAHPDGLMSKEEGKMYHKYWKEGLVLGLNGAIEVAKEREIELKAENIKDMRASAIKLATEYAHDMMIKDKMYTRKEIGEEKSPERERREDQMKIWMEKKLIKKRTESQNN